jgi:hypothetical protein
MLQTAGQESSTGTAIPATPEDVPSEDNSSISPELPSNTGVPTGVPTGAAPYPVNNGSAPLFPGSSGFLTQTRPTGPAPTGGAPGYGEVPVPSGTGAAPSGPAPTDGLPTFVLPSATPAEGTPVETPVAEQPTTTSVSPELPTSAYGGGYGYGSKKRSFFGLF